VLVKKRDAATIPPAIQWHEGLLLEPQHFQEMARRSERLVDYHLGYASGFHYGVVRCEMDGTLAGGVLRIRELEAIMPDGLVVTHPFRGRTEPASLEVKLTPAEIMHATRGSVIVYLVVARDDASSAQEPRFDTSASADARDDVGEASIEVPRLAPILKLKVSQGPPAPLVRPQGVALPLYQVRLGNNVLECVEDYEPPRLRVAARSRIHAFVRDEIIEPLRLKAGRLARAAMTLSESIPAESWRKLRFERQVQSLVTALPPIEALLDSGVAHPFTIYLALAGLVGHLSAASVELIPPAPANRFPYDHEDPLRSFRHVGEIIEGVRDGIQESFATYRLVYDQNAGMYQVRLPPGWHGKLLALGVRPRPDMPSVRPSRWMSEARICLFTPQRLQELEMRRATGARRAPRGEAPDARAKERLSEIAPPPGSEVYWIDEKSPDLQGDAPLIVIGGGGGTPSDAFEITVYVAYPESPAERRGAEG
jgi:type VI secretion system protein ImpJ